MYDPTNFATFLVDHEGNKLAPALLLFDMDEFKKNIEQFIKNPNFELLSSWLEFKKEAISGYVKEFSRRIKIKKSAFLFSPSTAPLVDQDYASLSSLLDKIHPMLYPEGSLGPASIGYEIYSLVSGHPSGELIKAYKQSRPRKTRQSHNSQISK